MRDKENLLIIFVVFAAVFVVYGAALTAGFIWDDEFLVVQNPLLRAPLLSFEVFRQDISNSNFDITIYYRPLQILSYALDYRLWGISAFGFHLTNLILHFANCLLVFFLAFGISREKTLSYLAAILFAVSPVHSGVVYYISGRADLLMFFFGLLSILSMVWYRKKGGASFIAASAAFLALALLSKEAAVCVPFLVLLTDLFMSRRRRVTDILAHLPNFIILSIYAAAHYHFFGHRYGVVYGAARAEDLAAGFSALAGRAFLAGLIPLGSRMKHALAGYEPLAAVYALAAALAAVLLLIAMRGRRRETAYSMLFYLVALAPMSLVAAYFRGFAEHWIYLASFGLFLLAAVVVMWPESLNRSFGRAVSLVVAGALIIFYSLSTVSYAGAWQASKSLSDSVLSRSPLDKNAMHFKAYALVRDGRATEASALMERYGETDPDDPRTWYIKGRVELAASDLEKAREDFTRALQLDGRYDRAYMGLAMLSFIEDDLDGGIKLLEKASGLNPRNTEALVLLTHAYSRSGKEDKALETALRAKKMNPYDYNVLVDLGTAYVRCGMSQEGARQYLEAIKLYPERSTPYYNLAALFHESGQDDIARGYVARALEVEPNFKPALELILELKK